MTTNANDDGPPEVENPFRGGETRERVYDAILATREPATMEEIAQRADCSLSAARKHLRFYAEEIGIALVHEGRPRRYERNERFLRLQRVDELAREYSVEQLQARVVELSEQIAAYREQFGAESPTDVDALAVEGDIEQVYVELGEWATAIEERRLAEQARQEAAGQAEASHS